jgi:hypothetical protein
MLPCRADRVQGELFVHNGDGYSAKVFTSTTKAQKSQGRQTWGDMPCRHIAGASCIVLIDAVMTA